MRGYKIEDREHEDKTEREVRGAMVSALAAQWNQINRSIERNEIRREVMEEEGWDVAEDGYNASERIDEAGAIAYDAAKKAGASSEDADKAEREARRAEEEAINEEIEAEEAKPYIKLRLIEQQMEALGARMMRPYEHHNELEWHMEYLDNGGRLY